MLMEGWVKRKAAGTEVVKLDTREVEIERMEAPKRAGVMCLYGTG